MRASQAPLRAADNVIFISVDALRGDLLKDLTDNDTAGAYTNFNRFADERTATFNARTDYDYSMMLPNHTSMATGRGVVGKDDHNVTINSDNGKTVHFYHGSYVASVFDVVHDNGLNTGLYASKSKFDLLNRSWNAANGGPDTTGPDNGTDKINHYYNNLNTHTLINDATNSFIAMMNSAATRHDYSFIHLRYPDSAGHSNGWDSAAWNTSVAQMDDRLGETFNLIETNGALVDKTAVIITADHKGSGSGHGNASEWQNYTIPFLVWGADIDATPSLDLYLINIGTRLDPGIGRPDLGASPQPIRNSDGANLALNLLGLGAIPAGSTINADQSLAVAPEPATLLLVCVLAPFDMGRRHRF